MREAFRSPTLSYHQVTPNYAGFSVQIGVLCCSEPGFWAINPGTKLGNSSREKEAVDPWLTLKHTTQSPLFRILAYLVHVASTIVWYPPVQFSRSVVSDTLWPHELPQARPPCPSPTSRVHSDSHPSSRWCHPDISSSLVPFSSCPQSLPASESFPMIPLLKENFQHLKLCLTTPLACFLFHSSWKYRIWGFILYSITYLNYNSDRHHLTFLSMTGYVSKERIMQCVCQYCLFKGFQNRNVTYFFSVS